MNDSKKSIILLYKTNLINEYRNSYIFKLLFGRKISISQILITKTVFLLVYFLIFYLLPMLLPEMILSAKLELSALLTYKEFLWNISLMFVFFMGMFVGANLIYDLTVGENFHILKFPITLEDLVYYRSVEAIFINLKICFYLTLPVFLYIALLSISQVILILFFVISYLCISFIFYFAGIIGILLLKKYLQKTKPERLFINIVLGSIILFAAFIRIIKDNNLLLIDVIQWLNANQYNIYFSPAHLINSAIIANGSVLFIDIFYLLIFQIMILLLLVKQTIISLNRSYKDIHLYSNSKNNNQELKSFITYNWINSYLLIVPIKIRPFIIKDVLTLLRKPYFILKFILLFLFIIILSLYRIETETGIDFNIFFIYLLPTYLISLLFINSIGFEKSNIYLVKRIFPSSLNFLITRFQVNLFSSLIILIPMLIFYSLFNFTFFNMTELIFRLFLVLLCIITITLLVTGYSASFSLFKNKYSNIYNFGISPVSMLVFWVVGVINSIFFYLLDISYLDSSISNYINFFMNLLGIIILILVTTFFVKGQNRIKNLL